MAFENMAPWDSLMWFDNPVETVHSQGSGPTQIAKANPRRVAIGFAYISGAATFNISNLPNVTTNSGWLTPTSSNPTWITQRDHGAYCQGPFYLAGGALGTILTIEIFLRDWPDTSVPEPHYG